MTHDRRTNSARHFGLTWGVVSTSLDFRVEHAVLALGEFRLAGEAFNFHGFAAGLLWWRRQMLCAAIDFGI